MKHPRTAYDVRRYITLIEVLALDDYDTGIYQLAKNWGVELRSEDMRYEDRVIHKLAKHVIDYHRKAAPAGEE